MTQSQDSGPSISIIFYEQTAVGTLLILILREAELRSVETVCLLCGIVSLHLSPLSQN